MTRKPLIALLAALGLTFAGADIAAARTLSPYPAGRETGTPGASQGVIMPAMGAGGSNAASSGLYVGATDQGKAQLAAELRPFGINVSPTDYTTSELSNMLNAAQMGHRDTVLYYMGHSDMASGGPGMGQSDPGKTQMAAQLGLNPNDYSAAQLQRISNDVQRGHLTDANYVAQQGDPMPGGIIVFVPVASH